MRQELYSGWSKLHGEEHGDTIHAAFNLASTHSSLQRHAEAKSLLRKTLPVARHVHGKSHIIVLKVRFNYALALSKDTDATLDDLREAVTILEDSERTGRRVFGGAHPLVTEIEGLLRGSRATLCIREMLSGASKTGST